MNVTPIMGQETNFYTLVGVSDTSAFRPVLERGPEARTSVRLGQFFEALWSICALCTNSESLVHFGFVLTGAVEDLDRNESKASEAGIALSAERLYLLDADLVVAQNDGPKRDDVELRDLFGSIPTINEGYLLLLPDRISDDLAFRTALSTSAVPDDLVALINKTVE